MSYISCYVYSLRGENKNDRELRAGQPEGKRERERERGREGGREGDREGEEGDNHTLDLPHEYTYLETQSLPNGHLATIIFNSSQCFPYLVSGSCYTTAILVAQ